MKDLYNQFIELPEDEKEEIIDYFKDVRNYNIERTEEKFLRWMDNLIKKEDSPVIVEDLPKEEKVVEPLQAEIETNNPPGDVRFF